MIGLRTTSLVAALFVGGVAGGASAQQAGPKIWDIPFGTHVADLPAEFVDPACGSNGGPAGQPLAGFADFAKCPAEASGLREVWFIYDDTDEFVGRAMRDASLIGRLAATTIQGQPVILSFLISGDGRLQGYRIITDPRADSVLRSEAHTIAFALKARFAAGGWQCAELPRVEGETKLPGSEFIKERCQQEAGGQRRVVETRNYQRPGQQAVGQFGGRPTQNEFESSARLEVIQVAPLASLPAPRPAATPAPAAAYANARDAFIAGAIKDCRGCNLSGADLRRRDLADADLSGANLEDAILHRANLRRAKLTGAKMAGANLNRADLTFANLADADLYNALLFQADAGRADFTNADLSFALMGRARLTLAILEGANLEEADLGEARMNDAKLANATLNGALLFSAVLFRADLHGASAEAAMMTEASLRDADLSGAVLRRADLTKADLAGADLTRADFSGAKLLSAILLDTKQDGTNFAGALMPNNARQ